MKIDLENVKSPSFFDYFTDIEIIPLETTDECVMGYSPTKFILHNNRYYCLDEKQKAIFIFDENGKFIKKIKKEGQGPGEYTSLDDFTINRFTGNLELMSAFSTINIYDSLGVEFKEKIYLPNEEGIIHNMENLTEDIYIFYNKYRKEKKVFFYSKSIGKVLADTYKVPESASEMPSPYLSPFYLYNDSVFFLEDHTGRVFEIDKDLSFKTKYCWDMGEYTFDMSILPENETMDYYIKFTSMANSKYAMAVGVNAENNKYYISSFRFRNKHIGVIYDKNNKKTMIIDKFKENLMLLVQKIDKNTFYFFFDANRIDKYFNPDILNEENRKKFDSINESDNPILIKYKLK
ncbi:MAG: 6-bladed beta-propeller [Dysgonomonas sp.]